MDHPDPASPRPPRPGLQRVVREKEHSHETRPFRPVAVGILILMLAPVAHAGSLTVVNVSSPAYQYVFSPAGSVVVQDTVAREAAERVPWAMAYSGATRPDRSRRRTRR